MAPRLRITIDSNSARRRKERRGKMNRKVTIGGIFGTLFGWVTLIDWSAVPQSAATIVGAVVGVVGVIATAIGDAIHKPPRDE